MEEKKITIPVEEIVKRLSRVNENGLKLDAVVNAVVSELTKDLDEFVASIYKMISDKSVDVPDVDIEYAILQLPCHMYFLSSKMEDLGLREDIARGLERERYNEIFQATEGRVSDKEGAAEVGSQREALVTAVNSRAYRKVKAKLEYASATLESLKKVLTNRISDKELTKRDTRA